MIKYNYIIKEVMEFNNINNIIIIKTAIKRIVTLHNINANQNIYKLMFLLIYMLFFNFYIKIYIII